MLKNESEVSGQNEILARYKKKIKVLECSQQLLKKCFRSFLLLQRTRIDGDEMVGRSDGQISAMEMKRAYARWQKTHRKEKKRNKS